MDGTALGYQPMSKGIEYPYVIERRENVSHADIAYNKSSLLSVLTNTYWVARMAFGLEVILSHAETIEDAKEIARDHLETLVDPVNGLRSGIPDDVRLRWRIASRKTEGKAD
jgi:hypothetical protein